jgi:exodeoxyribonuclease-3
VTTPKTIATWNVNSIAARLPLVLQWLEAVRPDVLCLQEIKCIDERFPREELAAAGYTAEVYGQPTYNGVAILSRHPLSEVRRGFTDGEPGDHARVISARAGDVQVVNVYVPNGQAVGTDKYAFKLEWLARLRGYLDDRFDVRAPVLLCGDFNVAPEPRDVRYPELWEGKVLVSEPERAALERVREWGLVDAFRLHTEEGGFFSWWDYRAAGFRRNDGLRIDHVWITKPLARRSTAAWIDRETRAWERPSDHAPVVVEFSLQDSG